MPVFDYKCADCKLTKEHFIYPENGFDKICPNCNSQNYIRQFGKFHTNIEYSNTHEHMEKVINPGVNEVYSQIGKEALDEDAGTLENIFGTEKIKTVLSETDD